MPRNSSPSAAPCGASGAEKHRLALSVEDRHADFEGALAASIPSGSSGYLPKPLTGSSTIAGASENGTGEVLFSPAVCALRAKIEADKLERLIFLVYDPIKIIHRLPMRRLSWVRTVSWPHVYGLRNCSKPVKRT
jgi:hypothetical protein